MEAFKKYFQTQDFEGQRKATLYFKVILIIAGAISFAVGYSLENYYVTVGILFIGYLVSLAVSVPSWNMYNRMNFVFGKKSEGIKKQSDSPKEMKKLR